MANVYLEHYKKQIGGGYDDIPRLYINTQGRQIGRGIGDFFRNIFKYIRPLFSAGIKFLKTDGIQTGANILQDLASKKSVKDILKNRGGDALLKFSEIAKKTFQEGSGLLKIRKLGKIVKRKSSIKQERRKNKRQSLARSQLKHNNTNKKHQKKIIDIFS